MTIEQLSAFAGIILSLAFSYIPKLEEWYLPLSRQQKQLVMLGSVVLVSVAIFAAACANLPFPNPVACTQESAWGLVRIIFQIAVANQTAYLLTRKSTPAYLLENK